MKTLLVTLLILFATDPPETTLGVYIADNLAKETSGFVHIDASDASDGSRSIVIKLPAYSSFDLLQSQVAAFTRRYSDVTIERAWRRDSEDESINATLVASGHLYFLTYYEASNEDRFLFLIWMEQ